MSDANSPSENGNLITLLENEMLSGTSGESLQDKVHLYFEQKARRQGIPLKGIFELTPECNLDCKMCYVHLNRNQYQTENLLSPSVWKSLIDQARAAGMVHAALTGGECLTYPDFDEIYLYLRGKGISPGILSNGILINRERVDFFQKYPPRIIQVTLYGSNDDAYESVTGRRVFSTVYRNLERMHEAHLPVSITLTPNEYMQHDVQELLDVAEDLKFPYHINSKLIPPRPETGRALHDSPTSRYIELYKAMYKRKNIPVTPIPPEQLPQVGRDGFERHGLNCGSGKSSFAITHDGHMCPCLSLYEYQVNPLRDGFEAAWRQINSFACSYALPLECSTCAYRKQCLRCAAMHKNAPTAGHCDPRICARTKELALAGIIKPIEEDVS